MSRLVAAVAFIAGTVSVIGGNVTPAAAAAGPTDYPAGVYVIDMGATQGRALATGATKGYGAIYDLIVNKKVPVDWVINPSKAAKKPLDTSALTDTVDFTLDPGPATSRDPKRTTAALGATGAISYSSGAFVIPAAFAADLTAGGAASWLATWRSAGVFIDGPITAPVTLPVYKTLTAWPRAVLDLTNGPIAAAYYVNAGIPSSSYRLAAPSTLTPCDDIYVMPHADPSWATHSNLVPFNAAGGFLWAACHSVNVLENLDSPLDADLAPNTNFLTVNGSLAHSVHLIGSPPYAYPVSASDPIMQFLGVIDTATQNGSEQIYVPKPGGWRPSDTILATDPGQFDVASGASPGPASPLVYGRGFGVPTNGLVMYEGGHSHNKGTDDDDSAQRAFFNLHLLAGHERSPKVTVTVPPTIGGGSTVTVSASITGGTPNYGYEWRSSCGGVFAQATGSSTTGSISTTFTPPVAASGTCNVRLVVTDACGRSSFGVDSAIVVQPADLQLTETSNHQPNGVAVGDQITYTLTIKNNGPGPSQGVDLSTTLPVGLSLVSTTATQGTCTSVGAAITCDLTPAATPTIASGATVTVTIVADVTATALNPTVNAVSVKAKTPDPNPANNSASLSTPVFAPGITVVSTPSKSRVASGGAVTYDYLVTNTGTGPANLTSVVAKDSHCAPVVRNPLIVGTTLVLGAQWNFSCSTTLTASTTNTATVTATDPSGIVRTATTTSFVAVVAPKIAIAMSPKAQTVPNGGTATFTVVTTNTGDVDLADVVVTDPLAPGCGGTIALLSVGGSSITTCSLPVGASVITNSATATAPNPVGGANLTATDTATVTPGTPALTIDKQAPAGPYYPGGTFNYTVAVTNTSNAVQSGLVVSDTLPAGVSLNGAVTVVKPLTAEDSFPTNGNGATGSGWVTTWAEIGESDGFAAGNVLVTGNRLEFSPNNAIFGASRTVDLSGTTTPAAVSFVCSGGGALSATKPLRVLVNGVVIGTRTTSCGGATLSFPIPAAQLTAGAVVRFDVTDNKKTQVDDVLVQATTSVPVTAGNPPTLTSAGGTYTLAPAQTATFTIPVKVDATVASGVTAISNTASVVSTQQTTSSSDSAVVAIINPSFTVAKTVTPAQIVSGGSVTYSVVVDNTGNGPLNAVTPTDPQCSPLTLANGDANANSLLDTAETWTYSCTTTLTADTTNTVTVDARDALTNPVGSQTAQAFVDVVNPVIDLVVTPAGPVARPGQPVTYTYRITNSGDVPLSNPGVADPNCSPLGGFVEVTGNGNLTLDPGEVWTYTCTLIAPATTPVDRTVTATALSPLGTAVSDAAPAGLRVINPAVTLTKTADDNSVPPGTPVVFTIVLGNTGDDPLIVTGVVDDQCSPISGPVGDVNANSLLDVNETWGYVCTTPITLDTTNTASATFTDSLGGTLSASDTEYVNVEGPSLILRTAANITAGYIGSPVTYSYEIYNNGETSFNAAAIDLTDPRCLPINRVADNPGNNDAVLAVGERWLYDCNYTVAAADVIAAGTVLNHPTMTATDVFGSPVGPLTAVAQVNVIDPSIAVQKTAAPVSLRKGGGSVTYTYAVTNTSSITTVSGAISVDSVIDDKCTSLTPVDDNADGVNDGDLDRDRQIDFNLLGVSETWLYRCVTTLTATTTSTVTVDATDTLGGDVLDATATATVFVADPRLALTKTAGPIVDANGSGVQDAGDTIAYSFAVQNTGNIALNSVAVTDPLLPSPAYTIACLATTLAPGAGTTCSASPDYTLVQADVDAGIVATTATVTGLDTNGDAAVPATATDPVPVAQAPLLTLTKTADQPSFSAVGDVVTYSLTVTNTGNVTLTNVDAIDDLPGLAVSGGPIALLAPGDVDTTTLTGSYTITQPDVDAGRVTSAATASGLDPHLAIVESLPSSATVLALAAADDSDAVAHDVTLADTVATNDVFTAGSVFSTTAVIPSSTGVLTFGTGGAFVFDPDPSFAGVVAIPYTVCLPAPDSAVCAAATQTIVVGPLAVNDFDVTPHDINLIDAVVSNDVYATGSLFTAGSLSSVTAGALTFNADGSFVFDPAASFAGVVSFPYTVCLPSPNGAACASAVQTIVVGPLAADDLDVINPSATLTDTVAGNDVFVTGSLFTAGVLSDATAGTATFADEGGFTFVADPGFAGVVSFPYTLCLPAPNEAMCASAVQTIVVGPLAVDDFDVTPHDVTVTDTVATNDVFPAGSVFSTTAVIPASSGVLTFNTDGSFVYDPAATFAGVVSFPYTLCLQTPNDTVCDNAVQTIVVGPLAVADLDIVAHDVTVTDTVAANDVFAAGSLFSTAAVVPASIGALTFNTDGSFIFNPAASFAGVLSFSYTVCLPAPNATVCDIAVQTIVVGPLAVNDSDVVPSDVILTDTVTGNDVYAAGSVFIAGPLSDATSGALTFDAAGNVDGSFVFDPDPAFAGVVSFPYTVCLPAPNGAECSSAIQTIVVSPLAVNDLDVILPATTLTDAVVGNDVFAASSTFTAGPLTDVAAGAVTFNLDGSFVFVADPAFAGVVSFPYTVCLPAPNGAVCSSAVQTIVVGPLAVADTNTVANDATLIDNVAPNDVFPAGSVFSTSAVIPASTGVLTFDATGSFTFNPAATFAGVVSFPYTLCLAAPNAAVCDTAVQTIVVGPLAVDDTDITPHDVIVTDKVATNDVFAASSTFTAGALSDATAGVLTFAAAGNVDGSFVFDPDPAFAGVVTFPYTVCLPAPNGTVCDTAVQTIVVGPLAVDDLDGVDHGVTLTDTVATNDVFAAGSVFAAGALSDAAAGSLIIDPAGSFTFDPTATFAGVVSFPYTVCLPAPNATVCSPAVETIVVGVLAVDDSAATAYDVTLKHSVATNDIVSAGSQFTADALSDPATGVLTFATDGSFTFDPVATFTGVVSFPYTTCLPAPNATVCDSAVQTIAVGALAVDDVLTVPYDVPVSGSVATNDVYPVGSVFTAAGLSDPAAGVMAFRPDGSFTFDPNPAFVGSVTTGYSLCLPAPTEKVCATATERFAVEAEPTPALTTVLTTTATSFGSVAEVISYTITATNTGNVGLTNVTIADLKAVVGTCSPATLAIGEALSCTASHKVTQADLDNASFVNDATADGTSPTGVSVSDLSDPVTLLADQHAQLSVTQTTTDTTYRRAGDEINYLITATNTGNVTLTGVSVTASNAVVSSCAPASPATLAPGASITCSAKHVVTEADLRAGAVVSVASAAATAPGGTQALAVTASSNPLTSGGSSPFKLVETGSNVAPLIVIALLLVGSGIVLTLSRRKWSWL